MSNEKERIYGIDPGSITDVEKINTMDEIDLWMYIDAVGYHIWYCNHAMAHDRIPKVDLTEEQYAMEYMVNQTRKFGVELPEPELGKHIVQTESYWNWYMFYSNHFKNKLTNEEWNAFMEAKAKGEDISKYLPQGSWKEPEKQKKLK